LISLQLRPPSSAAEPVFRTVASSTLPQDSTGCSLKTVVLLWPSSALVPQTGNLSPTRSPLHRVPRSLLEADQISVAREPRARIRRQQRFGLDPKDCAGSRESGGPGRAQVTGLRDQAPTRDKDTVFEAATRLEVFAQRSELAHGSKKLLLNFGRKLQRRSYIHAVK